MGSADPWWGSLETSFTKSVVQWALIITVFVLCRFEPVFFYMWDLPPLEHFQHGIFCVLDAHFYVITLV